jgi:MFS family permease
MNKSLKTLFTFNAIFVFASYLLGPLYAIFVKNIVGDVLAISITTSVLLVSTTLFTYLISKYGDKVKEKEYLLIAGYFVRAVVWFLFIFANSLQTIIILQSLLGMGEAFGSSSFSAIFAEHLDRNQHVHEYANWHLTSTLVGSISTVVGGIIVSRFGFSYLFLLMSILATISFFGILFKPRKLL